MTEAAGPNRVREALQQAAGVGEPAVGDAFARFTAVKRRAAIARSATVAIVGLAAAAALIFTLPGLNSGDTGGSFVGGDATATPRVRAVKHYEDRAAGFALDYPSEWEVFNPQARSSVTFTETGDEAPSDEGRVGFDCGGSERCLYAFERPRRTSVMVLVGPPENYRARLFDPRARGASVEDEATTLGGLSATRWVSTFPENPVNLPRLSEGPHQSQMFAWCRSCERVTYVVPGWSAAGTLFLEITAPSTGDPATVDTDVIVRSIARV